MPSANEIIEEASRQLTVCNACRYCEGYCPVFPAVEMRRDFARGDVFFLSNLCHDCRACYYACMYAPPHPFAVNLPQILTAARLESYRAWSWPAFLAKAFSRWRIGVAIGATASTLVLLLALILISPARLLQIYRGPGAFYRVIPFSVMMTTALIVGLYVTCVCMIGAAQFWRESGEQVKTRGLGKALLESATDVLTFRWLRGGGPGCYYPQQKPSSARRLYHALVFFGFLSATVSTILAAIYQHFLHLLPPHPVTSAPVLFGTIGGVAMIIGVIGLSAIKIRSDRRPAEGRSIGMDFTFLILLGLASASGILTLILRSTRAMGSLLSIHLALIAAFFISVPYGKFVHSIYRSLAILRHHLEQSARRNASGPVS
jgi:citrate/tricarballylate utilization protein